MTTARPKRYPSPAETGWLTATQIARSMGWTRNYTLRILGRFRAVLPDPQRPRLTSTEVHRWPATVIEDLRQLVRLPHEEIDPESDWLARYIQKGPHEPD